MSTTPRDTCCSTCIPEFPDVTVNQTVIQIGTTVGIFRQEVVDCTSSPSLLAVLPVVDEAVALFVNGLLQRQGTDYTISGQTISWIGGLPGAGSTCIAHYFASETGVQPGVVTTGTILGFGGSVAPTGYLFTDGLAVSQTTYAALFSVIGHSFALNAGDQATLDGLGEFRLPNLEVTFLDPSTNTVVSNVGIIKI